MEKWQIAQTNSHDIPLMGIATPPTSIGFIVVTVIDGLCIIIQMVVIRSSESV